MIKMIDLLLGDNKSYILKKALIGIVIISIFTIANILYPGALQLIIDDGLSKHNNIIVIKYIFIMSLLIFVTIIFKYIKTVYFFMWGKELCLDVKKRVMNKLFTYSMTFFKKHTVGDIISILEQDLPIVQNAIMNLTCQLFINAMSTIGYCIILVLIDAKIALLSIVLSLIYLAVQRKAGSTVRSMSYDLSKMRGKIQEISEEIIGNIENINSMGENKYFNEKYNNIQKQYYQIQYKVVKLKSTVNILDGFFELISLLMVIGIGGYMILYKNLTIGSLFSLILYVQKLNGPIVSCVDSFIELKKSEASLQRIIEIISDNQHIIKNTVCAHKINSIALSVDNLTFNYKDKMIFNDFNLYAKEKEKVAIIGKNGTGKTTLLNLIMRHQDEYNGFIRIGEKNIDMYDYKEYVKKVTFITQNVFVFSGTIKENIVMGLGEIEENEIYKALEMSEFYNDIKTLPNGIESILGRNGIKLSGGQLQKLALARLFLRKPDIILLDEPTAALDKQSEKIVSNNIFNHFKNSTILVVTHREEILNYCDRIIEL